EPRKKGRRKNSPVKSQGLVQAARPENDDRGHYQQECSDPPGGGAISFDAAPSVHSRSFAPSVHPRSFAPSAEFHSLSSAASFHSLFSSPPPEHKRYEVTPV